MGRATSGVLGMRFNGGDQLLALAVVRADTFVLVATAGGYAKRTPIEDYPVQGRGGKGVLTLQYDRRRGTLVGALIVDIDDELYAITSDGRGDPDLGARGAQGRPADEGGPPDEPGRGRHAAGGRPQRRETTRANPSCSDGHQESPDLVNDTTRTPDEPDRPVADDQVRDTSDSAGNGTKPRRAVRREASGWVSGRRRKPEAADSPADASAVAVRRQGGAADAARASGSAGSARGSGADGTAEVTAAGRPRRRRALEPPSSLPSRPWTRPP